MTDVSDQELLRRAVLNARSANKGVWQSRWVAVMDIFLLGSNSSRGLCLRFNLDPDEKVKR